MTLIIPPGFANAAFVFTSSQGTAPFVTTLGVDTSQYGGDFVGAANQMMAVYADVWGSETDADLTLDHVTLTVGDDGPGGSVDSTLTPVAMTRAGTGAAYAMSPILRKVTNTLGRRGRGRMFIPGVLTQAEVAGDGSITPTRRGELASHATEFFTALSEGDMAGLPLPPFLFHSQAPTDPTPIVSLTVSDLVGWIRGRIR